MYRKHLEHAAIVGLNFFLNLDHDLSYHVIIMFLLLVSFSRLIFTELAYHTNALIINCKHLLAIAKEYVARRNVAANNSHDEFAVHFPFRNNFLQKDIWQWRTK